MKKSLLLLLGLALTMLPTTAIAHTDRVDDYGWHYSEEEGSHQHHLPWSRKGDINKGRNSARWLNPTVADSPGGKVMKGCMAIDLKQVRATPSIDGRIIAVLNRNQCVRVDTVGLIFFDGAQWLAIELADGRTGWIINEGITPYDD
jgi:hypothetical protein